MGVSAVWILGDQLYYWYDWSPSLFGKESWSEVRVLMWESPMFFERRAYHVQKLTYIFAAMRRFAQFWEEKGADVTYYRCTDEESRVSLSDRLKQWRSEGVTDLYMLPLNNTEDALFEALQAQQSLNVHWLDDESFLTSRSLKETHFNGKESFRFASFYEDQRREQELLLTEDGDPLGGKWSLDEENREALSEDISIPERENQHTVIDRELIGNVKEDITELGVGLGYNTSMIYPISPEAARNWIHEFLEMRLPYFGTYQDAVRPGESFGFHSVFSPFLNVGILHPQEVVDAVDTYYREHADEVSLNQIEGFQRQIIGWREYVKNIYDVYGNKQRKRNVFGCNREIPEALWTGETGLYPIDEPLGRLLETGYLHHIERLMLFGNFFLLCEIHPDEVFEWFMSLFVDAYDWVMVPNVYGMSQFADGGSMMTKPYISSSNYLRKMTEFEDDGYWPGVWDALFWEFIAKHREYLASNARMGLMVNLYDKKSEDEKEQYAKTKEEFLENLYKKTET